MEKRSLLEARLKLGSLSVQDYVKQLEIREAVIDRLQEKFKVTMDALDAYALKYPEDDTASKALLKIFEETKESRIVK